MKNSTLIAATAAMLLVPATGMAQLSKAQTMQVKKVQMALEKVFGKKDKVKKADEIEADLQPGTVKSYKYNNGSYSYEMTTNYTYNTLGNVVTEKTVVGRERHGADSGKRIRQRGAGFRNKDHCHNL